MESDFSMDMRTYSFLAFAQQGDIEHEVIPEIGGALTLCGDLTKAFIIDQYEDVPTIGFNQSMRYIILSTWLGWGLREHHIVLVGAVEGQENTFEMRIPIDSSLHIELFSYTGNLIVGLLDINETERTYDIVEKIAYKRMLIGEPVCY